MTIDIKGPELKELKPRILVLGVGGAGGNAINGMIDSGMEGVEFVAVNTDAQDLISNKASGKIQLGANLTKGLGAGAKHEIGQAAAEESLNDIIDYIKGSNMVFITAGMGGGTGTGASHVIARAAKELNILTVGVVTLPFSMEGPKKARIAHQGLEELKKHLDANIVVPNQNLFKIVTEKTTFKHSFGLANNVLKLGVQSVTDLMVKPGLVNLDFADVETIMKGMGKAMMGTGEAEGEKRAEEATNAALLNPLIDEYSLKGAKGLLVNITGGSDLTLFEVEEAVNKIRAEVDPEAELIFGAIEDENLNGKIRVSIVATSLDGQEPETKPVVSMVHRLQSRNIGYGNNLTSTLATNQATLNATEGATALDMRVDVESNESINQKKEQELTKQPSQETLLGNISIESATYMENIPKQDEVPNFEVESIELVTPQLFSDDENINALNDENNTNIIPNIADGKESEIIENLESKEKIETKEPLLFEDSETEENFEIPAFLRRQKN
jgi:cell division protein FtsZ